MRYKTGIRSYSIAFWAILFAISCSGVKSKDRQAEDDTKVEPTEEMSDGHTTQHSLDWTGTYSGVIPCADCAGIELKISLLKEGVFLKSSVYLGKSDEAVIEKGRIEWHEQGSTITLIPEDGEASIYRLGESHLQMLDSQGKVITGDLADKYLLKKNRSDDLLEDKKWVLIDLMGQGFEGGKAGRQPFILFSSETGRITGNNGCNSITGTYTLLGNNHIEIGNLSSTRMACPEPKMEQAGRFNEALSKADNYTVKNRILSLHKAKMAELARFELQ